MQTDTLAEPWEETREKGVIACYIYPHMLGHRFTVQRGRTKMKIGKVCVSTHLNGRVHRLDKYRILKHLFLMTLFMPIIFSQKTQKSLITRSPSRNALSCTVEQDFFFCAFEVMNSHMHTHGRHATRINTCLFCRLTVCPLIVLAQPTSHSCLIGNESPDGTLATWWD